MPARVRRAGVSCTRGPDDFFLFVFLRLPTDYDDDDDDDGDGDDDDDDDDDDDEEEEEEGEEVGLTSCVFSKNENLPGSAASIATVTASYRGL